VADRAGDPHTAKLAAEIRVEEQRMLEWLRHEIVKLTDPFIREELEHVDAEGGWSEHDALSLDDIQRALMRAEDQA
jgi:hypothetical protein